MRFRARIQVTVVLCLLAGAACGDTYSLDVLQKSGPGVRDHWIVGDTLRMTATEWAQHFNEGREPTATSEQSPSKFSWHSADPSVADFVDPGVLVFRGTGKAIISVRGPQSGVSLTFVGCPPGSSIAIDPRNPVLNKGDTITFVHHVGVTGDLCDTITKPMIHAVAAWNLSPVPGSLDRWVAAVSGEQLWFVTLAIGHRTVTDTTYVTVR